MLENVQRSFTKRIQSLSQLSDIDSIQLLKLEPLELRRLHFDLINYFKILTSLSPLEKEKYFTIYNPPASSRSVMPYLQKPAKACEKLLFSFFFRSVDAWNFLPVEIRQLESLPAFKRKLKQINLTSFMKGNALR